MADKELYFTKEHEWIQPIDGDTVRVGITKHASEELGDIVFIDFTAGLIEVAAGDELVTVESVKSVSEVYAPVSGTVVKQNDTLEENPETVNDSPLEEGWMVEMNLSNHDELEKLLSQEQYDALVEEEEE